MMMKPVGCDHLDDAALVARFEALAIAPRDLRHREHVRLAFAMLAGRELAEGALRFTRALRRFVAAAGAGAKYHETLTWAYLGLVGERAAAAPCAPYASSLELVERNPDLLDHRGGALARCYDVDAITACPIARRVFVLPRS